MTALTGHNSELTPEQRKEQEIARESMKIVMEKRNAAADNDDGDPDFADEEAA